MSDKNNPSINSPGKSRIVSLVIAFLILFVVTFSLGIIVGKGLTERNSTVTENTKTPPSQVQAPEKVVVTEYDEVSALEEGTYEPETKPQESLKEQESTKEINTKMPREVRVEVDIEEESAIEVSERVKSPQDQKTKITVKSEPVRDKVIKTPKPDKKAHRAAIEEIAKTDQNKREGRAKLPPIDPKGSYTVQIGSFMDKKAAESVLKSMKSRGYPAYISTMTASNKQKWYRVRIGTFNSSEAANDYGANLKILEPEVTIVFITQIN